MWGGGTYLAVPFPRTLVLVADDVAVGPPLVHTLDDVFLRPKCRNKWRIMEGGGVSYIGEFRRVCTTAVSCICVSLR